MAMYISLREYPGYWNCLELARQLTSCKDCDGIVKGLCLYDFFAEVESRQTTEKFIEVLGTDVDEFYKNLADLLQYLLNRHNQRIPPVRRLRFR